MNYERLEQIYSDAVADKVLEELDFLHFVAFKPYGLSEQDIRRYAQNNGLHPNTVRQWKRKFDDKRLISDSCIQGGRYR